MATNLKNFNIGGQGNITISVSTTSARAAFENAAAPDIVIYNPSAEIIFVRIGDSSVVATAADFPIAPGEKGIYSKERSPSGDNTHIAALAASGTSSLYVVEGRGA